MLPEHYHEHDEKWIERKLNTLPLDVRVRVAMRCGEVYREIITADAYGIRTENIARHEANSRLRIFCKKHVDTAVKQTILE